MTSSELKEINDTYHCRAMAAIETYPTFESHGTNRTLHNITMKASLTNQNF